MHLPLCLLNSIQCLRLRRIKLLPSFFFIVSALVISGSSLFNWMLFGLTFCKPKLSSVAALNQFWVVLQVSSPIWVIRIGQLGVPPEMITSVVGFARVAYFSSKSGLFQIFGGLNSTALLICDRERKRLTFFAMRGGAT